MRFSLKATAPLLLAMGLIATTGCTDSEPATPPAPEKTAVKPTPRPESTWEKEIDQVRQGRSAEVRLLRTPVTDKQLADLAGLEELRRINLPSSQITDEGLAKIVEVAPQLELLRLGSPHITDAGIAHIGRMETLRFLHLIDVPLTDAGLVHLEKMTHLESFYLDGGKATDEGLSALITALPKLHFHRDQQHLPGDPKRDGH